jgi:cephalosporin hydroxylase
MNISEIAANAVKGDRASQHAWELEQMLNLVYELQPKVILEIGSYKGWSLWSWAQVSPKDATLISVDLPYKKRPGTGFDKDPIMQAEFEGHEMHYIRENSMLQSTKDKVVEALNGRTVDFLFIDGGHRYKTVRSDYEMYSPLVDGIIGFHDIANNHHSCRVIDLWAEIKKEYPDCQEFILSPKPRHVMGIGVINHEGEPRI